MFLISNRVKSFSNNYPVLTDILIIVFVLTFGMWQIAFFQNIMKWDIIDINLPWRYFTSECLRNGILPLWNPFLTSGFPQSADPMTWYPISWILGLAFGNDLLTLQYEYFFHLLIGALGVYKLGELLAFNRKTKILTSISFMFSGLFISNAQHFGWIVSGAWFPFIIYFYVKFCKTNDILTGLFFIICLYFMLSGGYPAFFIITSYILFGIFIYYLFKQISSKQSIASYLIKNGWIVLLFLFLSVVVLISSFELSNYISRADKFSIDYVQAYPLNYQALISFIFPFATTANVDFYGTDFSMVNCYIGVVLIVFITYALIIKDKKAIGFFLLGLFLLSIALADIFPFRKWIYYLPFMDVFRFPVVFRFFAYSSFILVGGIGYNNFTMSNKKDKTILYLLIGLTLIIIGFFIYNSFFIEKWKFKELLFLKFNGFYNSATINERIFLQAAILISLLSLLYFSFLKHSLKAFSYIILVIAIADMILSVQLNTYYTIIDFKDPNPIQNALKNLPEGFPKPDLHQKIIANSENSNIPIPYLWRNMNMYYKKPTFDGYTPYFLKTTLASQETGNYIPALNNPVVFLADSLSAENIIDPSFYDTLSCNKIEILKFSPNMIEIKIKTDKKQLLSYLQNSYPGWKVSVNNTQSKIIVSNFTFMSTWIDAGESIVKFEYRPQKIVWGFYVSLVTFLIILSAILFIVIKRTPITSHN